MALEDARTAFGGRIEGAFAPDFEPVARTLTSKTAIPPMRRCIGRYWMRARPTIRLRPNPWSPMVAMPAMTMSARHASVG